MKHTPGPWEIETREDNLQVVISPKHYDPMQVTIEDIDGDIEQEKANARLIASAPELLVWTIELLNQLKLDHPDTMDGVKEHVEKLIERATGGA